MESGVESEKEQNKTQGLQGDFFNNLDLNNQDCLNSPQTNQRFKIQNFLEKLILIIMNTVRRSLNFKIVCKNQHLQLRKLNIVSHICSFGKYTLSKSNNFFELMQYQIILM